MLRNITIFPRDFPQGDLHHTLRHGRCVIFRRLGSLACTLGRKLRSTPWTFTWPCVGMKGGAAAPRCASWGSTEKEMHKKSWRRWPLVLQPCCDSLPLLGLVAQYGTPSGSHGSRAFIHLVESNCLQYIRWRGLPGLQ